MAMGADRADGDSRERAGETSPLLPGEWCETTFRDDAEHWVSVYEELVDDAAGLAASAEGVSTPLDAVVSRYRCRLKFWRRRLAELTT
ncbi:MAG: hypothetical protein JOZ75_11295 [Candidatus Dormibacteraeota bacterium]|nr:hypothetical protein [Candidatus Dormibacteraeota bacterium]